MSVLHIGPEETEKIKNLRRFAEETAHWYEPAKDDWTPGDRPEYVLMVSGFRCVFTWTKGGPDNKVFRQLSMSAPGAKEGKFPAPLALYMVAEQFGFTGFDAEVCAAADFAPPKGWQAAIKGDDDVPNAVLAQEVVFDDAPEGGA